MKQTTNYQFNLIENDDAFSPNPLNENMEKVEAALAGLGGQLNDRIGAVMTALGSGGSTARIAFGSWTGDGSSGRTLTFQFKPVLVVAVGYDGRFCTTMVRGARGSQDNNISISVQWNEKSVAISGSADTTQLNISGYQYHYVAVGI